MRCAIYARFSSDLQDERSIADQVSLCRARAAREGWSVVEKFSDAAISGTVNIDRRPGLANLLTAAADGRFEILLTELIDRLSRDLEHIAGLHKRMRFLGVKIVTLSDGEIGKLHVAMRGLVSDLYLDDLAQKTRRGQIGRVQAGRIPGGRCYGYRVGEGTERGVRMINAAEADIVRRIFEEYVAGKSPLAIVAALNREGVKGPRGGQWTSSTINGSHKRANGIVSNRLYVGELVYNRQRFVKDPETGKRRSKLNPEADWLVQAVPELAIIDRGTFDTAQARRAAASCGPLTGRRRPKHILSGLVACGCCGSSMIVVREDVLGCSAQRNKGTCNNRRTISLREIEERVVVTLRHHLLAPDIVAAAVEAYRLERDRLNKRRTRARARQLANLRHR